MSGDIVSLLKPSHHKIGNQRTGLAGRSCWCLFIVNQAKDLVLKKTAKRFPSPQHKQALALLQWYWALHQLFQSWCSTGHIKLQMHVLKGGWNTWIIINLHLLLHQPCKIEITSEFIYFFRKCKNLVCIQSHCTSEQTVTIKGS